MRATAPHDLLQDIRRQLIDGSISPDTLSRRLSRILEAERARGPARMDTRLMAACEDLLWQLEPAARGISSGKTDGRRRLREGMAGQTGRAFYWPHLRLAAVALSLLLIAGGSLIWRQQQPRHQQLKSNGYAQGTPLPIRETTAITLAPSQGPLVTEAPTPAPTPEPTALPTAALTPTPAPTLRPATPTPVPGPKYVSLSALGAPGRWTETVSGPGAEFQVDVPVTVPEVSELPVLTMQWQPMEAEAIQRAAVSEHTGYATARLVYPDQTVLLQMLPEKDGESYMRGPGNSGGYNNVMLRLGEAAENSPIRPDQPLALLRRYAAQAGLDPQSIVVDAQAGSSRFYATRRLVGRPDPLDPNPRLDLSRPAEGFEKGYYRLSAAQMVDGVRVFPGNYLSSASGEAGDLGTRLTLAMADFNDFELQLRGVRRTGVRETSLPLASFDRVKATLRERIGEGLVAELRDIELGYMLYYAQYVKEGQEAGAPMLAVPVWRVRGLFLPSPGSSYPLWANNDIVHSITEGSYVDVTYEWRINAQTGEFIDPFPRRPMKSNPAILTWQQLQDSEEDVTILNRID